MTTRKDTVKYGQLEVLCRSVLAYKDLAWMNFNLSVLQEIHSRLDSHTLPHKDTVLPFNHTEDPALFPSSLLPPPHPPDEDTMVYGSKAAYLSRSQMSSNCSTTGSSSSRGSTGSRGLNSARKHNEV